MQSQRTNGRGEDGRAELSFRGSDSLPSAPRSLGGARSPRTRCVRSPNRRHVRGGWGWGGQREAGSRQESPAVTSLVVSRYQKNIQVWEQTYPRCREVGRGDPKAAGGGRGAPRIRTSSGQPGRATLGGRRRRPAARVASPAAPGGQESLLKVSLRCFPHSDSASKSSPSTGWERVPASTNQLPHSLHALDPAVVGGSGRPGPRGAGERGRGLGRRGREGRGAPRRLAEGKCGRRPLCSPPACAPLPFAFIPEARACLRSVPA